MLLFYYPYLPAVTTRKYFQNLPVWDVGTPLTNDIYATSLGHTFTVEKICKTNVKWKSNGSFTKAISFPIQPVSDVLGSVASGC